jgi:2-polyprenyl-3-methyl-5-hydroxy-6-metoxy-1,4-benzoquinol methylase
VTPEGKNIYNAEFYDSQKDGSYKSAKIILPLVLKVIPPVSSAADFGCGTGTWLAVLKELGVDEIKGYDGEWVEKDRLLIPSDCFEPAELGREIKTEKRYDLAVSVEVAEHLPEESAGIFVKTLTDASDIVLLTAFEKTFSSFQSFGNFEGGVAGRHEHGLELGRRLIDAVV